MRAGGVLDARAGGTLDERADRVELRAAVGARAADDATIGEWTS
jgi:hypothetical protein